MTRRSCSGTAASRSPTSRSATPCWRRRARSASARGCAFSSVMSTADLMLDGSGLTVDLVAKAARGAGTITIAETVWPRIDAARAVVERYAEGDEPVYGLNTGLGGNLGHRLGRDEIAAFQVQLIRGRAVALGPPFPTDVVRAALIARAN